MHGELPTAGYLLSCIGADSKKHSIAYLTDCSFICEESLEIIKQNCGILDHVIIDALREVKHSTHCSFSEALEYANQLCAKNTWFTHICHESSHMQIVSYIQDHLAQYPQLERIIENGGSVAPAYDGLVISCGE